MWRRALLLLGLAFLLLPGTAGAVTGTEFNALKARVVTLETKVAALQAKIPLIESRLSALETPPVEEPPVEEPPPPPPEGTVLFSGSRISDFALNQSAPGAVTEVFDPLGSAEIVLKMVVSDSDVAPVTPTNNPRAQLLTPSIIQPGDTYWWKGKFFLPLDFPASVPGWLNIIEGAYGPPFAGSPPFQLQVVGERLQWTRNATYGYDVPWSMPLPRGRWVSYLVHEKLAAEGFVELWIDGQLVASVSMKTLDSSNNGGPNFLVIQNYRKVGMFGSVTVYHGPTKVGTTRASVG